MSDFAVTIKNDADHQVLLQWFTSFYKAQLGSALAEALVNSLESVGDTLVSKLACVWQANSTSARIAGQHLQSRPRPCLDCRYACQVRSWGSALHFSLVCWLHISSVLEAVTGVSYSSQQKSQPSQQKEQQEESTKVSVTEGEAEPFGFTKTTTKYEVGGIISSGEEQGV